MLETIIIYWIKLVRLMVFLCAILWCGIFWYWILKFLIIK